MIRKAGNFTIETSLNETPTQSNYYKYYWYISSCKGKIMISGRRLSLVAAQALWEGTEKEILEHLDNTLSAMSFEVRKLEHFILSHQDEHPLF